MDEFNLHDPAHFAAGFMISLADPTVEPGDLRLAVTPESEASWGDFSLVRELYMSIPDAGFGSVGQRAVGDPDVHYVPVFSGIERSFQVTGGDTMMKAAMVVTLVWRASLGGWRVHAVGDYVSPEEVPHD